MLPQPEELGHLTTELERELGKIVRKKYKKNFYVLYRYPLAVRSFLPDTKEQFLLKPSCDWV